MFVHVDPGLRHVPRTTLAWRSQPVDDTTSHRGRYFLAHAGPRRLSPDMHVHLRQQLDDLGGRYR